uniref:Uncharacterized protein n=1 Tax=Oryza sativa subsp. japonica TaxID=39947 RepID=Q5Z5E9_ORYSJ|nr:hypothetical protein [Oryza sativa Japonica Group]
MENGNARFVPYIRRLVRLTLTATRARTVQIDFPVAWAIMGLGFSRGLVNERASPGWHFPPRHHRSRPTPSSSGCRTRDGGGALAATFRIPPQLERTQQVGRGLAPSGGVLHLVLFVAVLCRLLNQRRLARTVASNDDGRNPMGVNMGSSMV